MATLDGAGEGIAERLVGTQLYLVYGSGTTTIPTSGTLNRLTNEIGRRLMVNSSATNNKVTFEFLLPLGAEVGHTIRQVGFASSETGQLWFARDLGTKAFTIEGNEEYSLTYSITIT